jgi:hypothetical protein
MVHEKGPEVETPFGFAPEKVTPLIVGLDTVPFPQWTAPSNVPAVLTSESPEILVAGPQETIAALAVIEPERRSAPPIRKRLPLIANRVFSFMVSGSKV